MPGCAGNFLARLFSLSKNSMPLMPKFQLDQLIAQGRAIDAQWPRLEQYKFSQVLDHYNDWQKFHRDWPDFQDYSKFRLLNLISGSQFAATIFCIHPHEMHRFYLSIPPEEFYHVDLNFDIWGKWWALEQSRLKFMWRQNEQTQFELLQQQHQSQPIDLTAMLTSVDSFVAEYTRVCKIMQLELAVDWAIALRQDWYKTRVACYE